MDKHLALLIIVMLPLCSNSQEASRSRPVSPTTAAHPLVKSYGTITENPPPEIDSSTNQIDVNRIASILLSSMRPDFTVPEVYSSSNRATRALLCKLYKEWNTNVTKCPNVGPGHAGGYAQRSFSLAHSQELSSLVRNARSMSGNQSNAVASEAGTEDNDSANRRQISTSRIVAAPKRTIRFPTSMPLGSIALPSYLKAVTSIPEEVGGSLDRLLPELLTPLQSSVTTRAGQTASLTCYVRNLGNRQLTWIRGKDLHVLSSGTVTFASDSRVSVSNEGEAWTLTIRYSQPKDGGQYACQVNTQPPMAVWYNLTVIEARAVIDGKETMYVQAGSNITLTCTVKEQLVIPGLVLWYHGEALVARDSTRVSVATTTDRVTESVLTISSARSSDSGNYSCWPSAGAPDSILLHVIKGEPPAAMQHGHSATLQHNSITTVAVAVVVLLHSLCQQHYNSHSCHNTSSSSHYSDGRSHSSRSYHKNRSSSTSTEPNHSTPLDRTKATSHPNTCAIQPPPRGCGGEWGRVEAGGGGNTPTQCWRRPLVGATRRHEPSKC